MKLWKGRINPDAGDFLLHQKIQPLDMTHDLFEPIQPLKYALLGFCSDEGVRRNLGRVGARNAPDDIRKVASGIALHLDNGEVAILDAGNVICSNQNLEQAQDQLAQKVSMLLDTGYFPIVLGGGHETAFGHFKGLYDSVQEKKKIGIVNLDAHFDLRRYDQGAHSGSPFRQIADTINHDFHYFPIGIRPESNTSSLFEFMKDRNQEFVYLQEVHKEFEKSLRRLSHFVSQVDHVYLSIDLDCFPSAFAPGVSASAPDGLFPWQAIEIIHLLHQSAKMRSVDLVEINPDLDLDGRTLKLAATLIYHILHPRLLQGL